MRSPVIQPNKHNIFNKSKNLFKKWPNFNKRWKYGNKIGKKNGFKPQNDKFNSSGKIILAENGMGHMKEKQ